MIPNNASHDTDSKTESTFQSTHKKGKVQAYERGTEIHTIREVYRTLIQPDKQKTN